MSAHPEKLAEPSAHPDERMLYARIRHLGRTLDDLENLRIRHENRRGAFQRDYQIPLPPDAVSATLAVAERGATLELVRLARQLPLIDWQKEMVGVGAKQFARLLAEIGRPDINSATGEQRTVSQLWAYSSFDPTRRHKKGMSQEEALGCGNPQAKKRAYLIAAKCIIFDGKPDKNGRPRGHSPFRDVYDARRLVTAEREDWTDGHRHQDALRITAKEILKQLWLASRQESSGTQRVDAGGNS